MLLNREKTLGHYALTLEQLASKYNVPFERSSHQTTSTTWIDNQTVASLVKQLWLHSNDEFLGLAPDPMPVGTWGVVCEFMLGGYSLKELYLKAAHILAFLPPHSFTLMCDEIDDVYQVSIDCYQGTRDPHRFLTEFICVTCHRFPCWAVDQYIPLKKAWFSFPAPDHAWFYEELFQCSIEFDQATTGFSFSTKYLNSEVCRSKTDLKNWLSNSPADLLYLPGRNSTISSQIRKQIDLSLRRSALIPSFEVICETLHMSPAVVRRRLSEEGDHYQNIKDSTRLDLIKELLCETTLSLAEISDKSGFKEVASLSRAFKKWTSLTPAQYRSQPK